MHDNHTCAQKPSRVLYRPFGIACKQKCRHPTVDNINILGNGPCHGKLFQGTYIWNNILTNLAGDRRSFICWRCSGARILLWPKWCWGALISALTVLLDLVNDMFWMSVISFQTQIMEVSDMWRCVLAQAEAGMMRMFSSNAFRQRGASDPEISQFEAAGYTVAGWIFSIGLQPVSSHALSTFAQKRHERTG